MKTGVGVFKMRPLETTNGRPVPPDAGQAGHHSNVAVRLAGAALAVKIQ
ncbi:Uncharacterised protein [Bordetella pertussis]|nr:Uncharacterised protein [Bordetella pertussis]